MSQFKKYPKIYTLGSDENREFFDFENDSIIIEEKVDGGNFSCWLDKDQLVHVGSRNRDLTEAEDHKIFAKQRAYLAKKLENKKLDPDYIYYLECMAQHTIKYDDNIPDMIGIDIRAKRSMKDGEYGLFLARERRCQLFDDIGIENVPLVWRGKVGELKKLEINSLIPQSKYYKGRAEGIVLKNYCRLSRQGNHQLYAKVVIDEFKENNKAIFGCVRKKNPDTEKIVEQYCTDARVKKQIQKLLNEENQKLGMELMGTLPRVVATDILQENILGIFEAYKWLDFASFKKMISQKCVRVLKEYIFSEVSK